jgi:hypothetical protein
MVKQHHLRRREQHLVDKILTQIARRKAERPRQQPAQPKRRQG